MLGSVRLLLKQIELLSQAITAFRIFLTLRSVG